jgi:hypothetical protein
VEIVPQPDLVGNPLERIYLRFSFFWKVTRNCTVVNE